MVATNRRRRRGNDSDSSDDDDGDDCHISDAQADLRDSGLAIHRAVGDEDFDVEAGRLADCYCRLG